MPKLEPLGKLELACGMCGSVEQIEPSTSFCLHRAFSERCQRSRGRVTSTSKLKPIASKTFSADSHIVLLHEYGWNRNTCALPDADLYKSNSNSCSTLGLSRAGAAPNGGALLQHRKLRCATATSTNTRLRAHAKMQCSGIVHGFSLGSESDAAARCVPSL